jgi:AcrR family transcriptional regulator
MATILLDRVDSLDASASPQAAATPELGDADDLATRHAHSVAVVPPETPSVEAPARLPSAADRRQLDRQARRRKIQRVARRIFSERGFAGTTIDEIARKSTLSVGAIYLYFKSKEELYVSLLQESLELLTEELERIRQQGGDPRAQLRAVWERLLSSIEIFKDFHRAILLSGNPPARQTISPDVVGGLGQATARNVALLDAIVEDGIASGVYRAGCKGDAADLLWSALLGLVALGEARLHLDLPVPAEGSEAGRRAFDTLERALLA